MTVFGSKYFRTNKLLLHYLGLWPYDTVRTGKYFYFILLVSFSTAVVPLVCALKGSWPNFPLILECLVPVLCILGVLAKVFNLKINEIRITNLMDRINKDWQRLQEKKDHEFLEKYAEFTRSITIIYWLYVWISTAFFTILPRLNQLLDVLVPLNESRTQEQLFPFEYYLDQNKYYNIFYAHQMYLSFLAMTIVVAVDSMVAVLVSHPCCLFSITAFADNLRNAHSMCYFVEVIANMFVVSVTAVQIIARPDNLLNTLRYIFLTLGQIFHLLFNCLPGQVLMDHSLYVSIAGYSDAVWYKLSTRSRRLLLIMMMRAAIPCELRAGKFFVMSMESYRAVLSTSMSYFTVFASIR